MGATSKPSLRCGHGAITRPWSGRVQSMGRTVCPLLEHVKYLRVCVCDVTSTQLRNKRGTTCDEKVNNGSAERSPTPLHFLNDNTMLRRNNPPPPCCPPPPQTSSKSCVTRTAAAAAATSCVVVTSC